MAWNHRVLRHVKNGEILFAIHEVYYDENNNPHSCTAEPVYALGYDTLDNLALDLQRMLDACKKPVLDYEPFVTRGRSEE